MEVGAGPECGKSGVSLCARLGLCIRIVAAAGGGGRLRCRCWVCSSRGFHGALGLEWPMADEKKEETAPQRAQK